MISLQDKKQHNFQRILIVGLGVMGGSFAKSLQGHGIELFFIDKNESVCEQAVKDIEMKCITYDDIAQVGTLDLIIVTVMPQDVLAVFSKLDKHVDGQTLVIEISGIKTKLVESMQKYSWNFSLVLTHPMAGRENGGFAWSQADLFSDANILIIKECMTATKRQLIQLENFWKLLGTDKLTYISAQKHDEHITFTSQLSHVLASSLILSTDYDVQTKHAIGDSFRDLTRIANMNIDMWQSLFIENKEMLIPSIDALILSLDKMKEAISKEDVTALQTQLSLAKERRESF